MLCYLFFNEKLSPSPPALVGRPLVFFFFRFCVLMNSDASEKILFRPQGQKMRFSTHVRWRRTDGKLGVVAFFSRLRNEMRIKSLALSKPASRWGGQDGGVCHDETSLDVVRTQYLPEKDCYLFIYLSEQAVKGVCDGSPVRFGSARYQAHVRKFGPISTRNHKKRAKQRTRATRFFFFFSSSERASLDMSS